MGFVTSVASQGTFPEVVGPSKSESRGHGNPSARNPSSTTKQVTSPWQPTVDPEDPWTSDSEEEGDIQVQDKGSRLQYAHVQIGGVATWGIVESGADITIIGKRLFQSIAAANNLREA